MKNKIAIEDVKGKTIERYIWGVCEKSIILTFTDGTYLILSAYPGYEDSIEIEDNGDCYVDFSDKDLIRNGFISKKELMSVYAEKDRIRLESLEENERKTYERLRSKYSK